MIMASAPSTPKAGWEVKTLGEVCEFRNGLWKGKKPPYVHVGVIRNTNFTKAGCLDDSDIAYLDVEQKQFEKRRLEYGDIILEKSGGGPKQPVGRVITFEKTQGKFSFSNFTSVIRIIDSSAISFKFLHRFLYWNYVSGVTEGMQRRSTGIRNLDFTAYKQIPVPLPPLPEQERIVGILDEAFEGIAAATAQAEKNLHNARELFQSVLQSTFSQKGDDWVDRPIGELCDILNGFAFKSKDAIESSNVQVIRMGNLYQNELSLNRKPAFYPENFSTEFEPFLLSEGDIIMSLTGTVGKEDYGFAVRIPETERKLLLNQRIAKFHSFNGTLYDSYFLHFLKSRVFLDVLYSTSRGTRQANLSSVTIKELTVPISPLPTQQAIVEKLDALSEETKALEAIYERKQSALAELKQSLLQKAFAGEL
jgi:type I restriction enzyme S subunit